MPKNAIGASCQSKRGDTKGAYLSGRHTVSGAAHTLKPAKAASGQPNLYAILGIDNDVEPDVLKAAYREKALVEHPDKGGDQDRFDAIFHAFNLLQDPVKRLAYDEELAEIASQTVLVEGKPEIRSTGEGVAHKKTAPTAGSKRQKDWHQQSEEWAGEKSGSFVLRNIRLALTDAAGPMSQKPEKEMLADQTEALFKKFRELPKGSKAAWMNSLDIKQKAALKVYAKAEEAKAMDKAKKWLGKA